MCVGVRTALFSSAVNVAAWCRRWRADVALVDFPWRNELVIYSSAIQARGNSWWRNRLCLCEGDAGERFTADAVTYTIAGTVGKAHLFFF